MALKGWARADHSTLGGQGGEGREGRVGGRFGGLGGLLCAEKGGWQGWQGAVQATCSEPPHNNGRLDCTCRPRPALTATRVLLQTWLSRLGRAAPAVQPPPPHPAPRCRSPAGQTGRVHPGVPPPAGSVPPCAPALRQCVARCAAAGVGAESCAAGGPAGRTGWVAVAAGIPLAPPPPAVAHSPPLGPDPNGCPWECAGPCRSAGSGAQRVKAPPAAAGGQRALGPWTSGGGARRCRHHCTTHCVVARRLRWPGETLWRPVLRSSKAGRLQCGGGACIGLFPPPRASNHGRVSPGGRMGGRRSTACCWAGAAAHQWCSSRRSIGHAIGGRAAGPGRGACPADARGTAHGACCPSTQLAAVRRARLSDAGCRPAIGARPAVARRCRHRRRSLRAACHASFAGP